MNRSDSKVIYKKHGGIIEEEENIDPNLWGQRRYPANRCESLAEISASSAKLQTLVNLSNSMSMKSEPSSKPRTGITLHNVTAFILVKALIIAVLINFHMVSMLSALGPRNSFSPMPEGRAMLSELGPRHSFSPMPEGREALRLTTNRDVWACVRNAGDKCQLYPCIHENDSFVETDVQERPFGYAGRFVHRVDVDKQLMHTIGDRGWGSGCAISDAYKFVYIHVLKSGGTATKEFLRKSLCGVDDKDCKHVDPHILRPSGCRAAILNYTDYFTFSFVRNPFSRMYSMYSMMDGFPMKPGQKVTDTYSFHDFVLKPGERKNHTTMHAGHYDRQKNFVFSNHTCPSFDFIGRVEHYDEDMRTILNHLHATKVIEYLDKIGGSVEPANTWGSDKKQTIGGDLRKEYSSNRVIQTVARVYGPDFELFGYDKFNVPSS